MNAFLLLTGGGALVILTSHSSVEDTVLLKKLSAKGIDKFLSYRVPIDLAKSRYGAHFDLVVKDLAEADDLRVLDYSGERAFKRFRFEELGPQVVHEPVHCEPIIDER